jgi:3-methyl-2-oxobutanoate hydroxymethyltransferase
VSKPITLHTLQEMKRRGEKFVCITAYDALFAGIFCKAGVEVLLIGDSLGMVLQGHDSTLPVTMDDMVYHMQCVKRGNQGALLIADLPFMSYASPPQTLENAASLMRAGAQMVKLEGGAWIAETTRLLSERGIPVCSHMGLGSACKVAIRRLQQQSSRKLACSNPMVPACCCLSVFRRPSRKQWPRM